VSEGSVIRRLGDLAGAMRHYRRLTSVDTPREDLLALQRRRLLETARHAAAASPIYRELYPGTELAEDLDVRALPCVTKGVLMERFDERVTDPRLKRSEVEAHLERVRGDELYLGAYRCMPRAARPDARASSSRTATSGVCVWLHSCAGATIVTALPREQDHSAKFKLIESRITPSEATRHPRADATAP
jgi:hypothetical protein